MRNPLCLILLLACCLASQPSTAAEAATDTDLIALEIRNLSTSVDRLTDLLYQQAQQNSQQDLLRKLDIAVSYLNFRSRRIEMIERDMRSSASLKTRLEDVIQQWEQRLEDLENSRQTGQLQDTDDQEVEEAKEQLKMLKQRLSRMDTEIIQYENRITELRERLDSVESFVEKNLQL